ncbi:MAG: VWA domain-containing protein, partial [Sphingobacteriia bacterium]
AGQALGRDAGQFSIGKSAIEYRDLKADADLMRQLSLQTGGLFSYVSQLPSLADRIKQTGTLVETLETKRATRSLQQYVWPLLLLLALLSAEWILRKRNSLS